MRVLQLIFLLGLGITGEAFSIAHAVPIGQWKSGDQCPSSIPSTLSVNTFGALPNDAVDDSVAMQRAADFLCQCGSGKTLVYPAGHYDVKSHISHLAYNLKNWSIAYIGCKNVSIKGPSVVIDVFGDFRKEPDGVFDGITCGDPNAPVDSGATVQFAYASQYALAPIWIDHSNGVRLSGFEIDGHGQQTTMDVRYCYQEGHSHGIGITYTQNFSISNMNIHHMTVDGISLSSSSRDGSIDNVTVTNNARNDLSLSEVRNLRVTNSRFLDAGKLGTQPDSYKSFSNRGVAFEPEVLPADADWKRENDHLPAISPLLSFLPGNFLFDHVIVTGNIGGQMSFAKRGSGANVTVINSTLRSPLQDQQQRAPTGILEGGVAGLYVKNCIIDADKHMVYPSREKNGVGQVLYASPSFAAHLADMANDPSSFAQGVFRERKWFASTRLIQNTISGAATLLHTEGVLPLFYVWDNTFTGKHTSSSVKALAYPFFGYLSVWMGRAYDQESRSWADDVQFIGNRFFIPDSAPRHDLGAGTTGEMYFSGVNRFVDNQFITDRAANSATQALRITYDQTQLPTTVSADVFPSADSLYPVNYPAGQPIPLSTAKALNMP